MTNAATASPPAPLSRPGEGAKEQMVTAPLPVGRGADAAPRRRGDAVSARLAILALALGLASACGANLPPAEQFRSRQHADVGADVDAAVAVEDASDSTAPAPDADAAIAPDATADAGPETTADVAPDSAVDAAPDVPPVADVPDAIVAGDAVDILADTAPDVAVDATVDAAPEVEFDLASDVPVPDVADDVPTAPDAPDAPDALAADAVLDAATDVAPDIAPDAAPADVGPDVPPDPCAGKTCDDNLACTNDTCLAGACAHATQGGSCLIGGVCHASGDAGPQACQACLPGTSPSDWSPLSGGITCTDGDACTTGDGCAAGLCQGVTVGCDDGNACTNDSCDKASGCQHMAANAAACDDGNACTTGDGCKVDVCVAGNIKDCSDGVACTTDSCDAKTGVCGHAIQDGVCLIGGVCHGNGDAGPAACLACVAGKSASQWSALADGTICSDGSACTVDDACAAGVCAGTAVTCPPWQTCLPASGCVNTGCVVGSKIGQCVIQ